MRLPAAIIVGLACLLPADVSAADGSGPAAPAAADAETLFVRRIAPLFAAKCGACHGADPDAIEGGLAVTSREAILRGGESGSPAVVPGKPAASPIVRAVRPGDAEISAMPPKEAERLSDREVRWIEEWVAAGAA